MNRAIKYRLYPTTEQAIMFTKTFGCCRKIYNLMLADKIAHYEATGKLLHTTPAQYKTDYPFLKKVDSLALANMQLHLQAAYKNFFRDKKIGLPKFKSAKRSRKSYTTNNQNGTIMVFDNAIKLPKIGKIKAVIHRKPNNNWVIKSATVSQDGDGKYYVSVLCEIGDIEISKVTPTPNNTLGLDYKSDVLYMDSNGNVADMPHYYRKSQKLLAKQQRKLRHMVIGSKNYYKQQRKVAKIHRHVANQRKDFLHKLSTEIANRYAYVCVEDLNMKSLSNKGFGNGKTTLDNGNGMFINFLNYKLSNHGGALVKIDKYYPSSQMCSDCGYLNAELKNLQIRTWTCPKCGRVHDRDHNAAVNIKMGGLRLLQIA